jgi:hypothetical protein
MSSDVLKKKMQTATLIEKQVFAWRTARNLQAQADLAAAAGGTRPASTPRSASTRPAHGFVPRAYSIAGSPLDEGTLEFYIALVDNGQLTPTIFAQELGATFHYLSAKGRFTLKHSGKRTIVMIATGTGLAPFVAQIRSLWKLHRAASPPAIASCCSTAPATATSSAIARARELCRGAQGRLRLHLHLQPRAAPTPARGWTPAIARGRVNEVVRHVFDQPIPAGRR